MPSYLPGVWYKEQCVVSSGEDGRVGGFSAHLVPWIHPDNTHISVNNPENNQQTRRTGFPQLIIENCRKGRDMVRNLTDPKTAGRREGHGKHNE